MYRLKGFALVQALFFMMFLMAMMAILLMANLQKGKQDEAERVAVDAYPVAYAFVDYALGSSTNPTSGSRYFEDHPISSEYCQKLASDGLMSRESCDNGAWINDLSFSKE